MATYNKLKLNESSIFKNENFLEDNQILISKLQNSFKLQKQFVEELNSLIDSDEETDINKTNKIISILPKMVRDLKLSFTYLFLQNKNLITKLISLSADQENQEISLIFQEFFKVLDFSLYDKELNFWKKILLEFGVLKNNEQNSNNKENTNNLEADQYLYNSIKNLQNQWSNLRSSGNENDYLFQLNNNLNSIKDDLQNLQKKNEVNVATIEFFQELIKKIEDFKNENKKSDEEKKDNNNIKSNNNNIKISQEEKSEKKIQQNINNIKPKNNINNNKDLCDRAFFYEDEKINEKNSDTIEFEKLFQFPLNSKIEEELKRQYCSFLNTQGGRIYIGIDQNIVKGVVLNYKCRDILRNSLVNIAYNFYPKCRIDKFSVYFIPIKKFDTEIFLKDLFVIKIRVYPGDPCVLYSMNGVGYRSCIRINGKCVDMNYNEIYEEIIKRNELKNTINKDNNNVINNIKDPEPEINPNESKNVEYNDESQYIKFKDEIYEEAPKYKEKFKKKRKKNKEFIEIKISNIDTSIPKGKITNILNVNECYSLKILGDYGYAHFKDKSTAENYYTKMNGFKIGSKSLKLKIVNQ